MKKIQIAVLVVVAGLTIQARATLYDITFNGSGITANGQIDVVGGIAQTTGSFLDVTSGPNQGTFNLLAAPGVETSNGEHFGTDNEVTPGTAPFLDNNGLQFGNAIQGFALFSTSPTAFELFGYNYSDPLNPEYGVPTVTGGSATLSLAPVPEASTMIAGLLLLLPFGASALKVVRKHRPIKN